jgi:hypothetical protein
MSLIKTLVEEHRLDMNYKDPVSGRTALFQAIISHDKDLEPESDPESNLFGYILSHPGVDVNTKGIIKSPKNGEELITPLTASLIKRQYFLAENLILLGADVDSTPISRIKLFPGFSPILMLMHYSGYKFLLEFPSAFNLKGNNYNMTPNLSPEVALFKQWLERKRNSTTLQVLAAISVQRMYHKQDIVKLMEEVILREGIRKNLLLDEIHSNQEYLEIGLDLTPKLIQCQKGVGFRFTSINSNFKFDI